MDLPVHIAAGALTGSIILYAEAKFDRDRHDMRYMAKLGLACFLWGTLGHLVLDALPHYDWLFKVSFFKPLPHYWMHPQLVTAVPTLILSVLLTKDYWPITTLAVLGGVYPDIEKLAYLDLHLPKFFVLFPWHSLYLSGRPWEHAHKHFLIFTEIVLFFLMIWWMLRLAANRRNRLNRFIPPLAFLDSLQQFAQRLFALRLFGKKRFGGHTLHENPRSR